MINPSVSIVIPALNAARTIERTLQSILSQKTNLSYEVIVVDNGSTDNTLQVLEKFPVIMLSQKIRGPAAARNLGVSIAKGKYIAFLDADVVIKEDWLEQSFLILDQSFFSGTQGPVIPQPLSNQTLLDIYRIEFGEFSTYGSFNHTDVPHQHPVINTAACLYLADAIRKVGGFDENLLRLEDSDLTRKIIASGGHICSNDKAVAHVYWDKDSINYFVRAFKNGYYHAGLKFLWSEKLDIFSGFHFNKLPIKISHSSFAFYVICKAVNFVGHLSSFFFFSKSDFEDKAAYKKLTPENFFIFSVEDAHGQHYTLAPWIRINRNKFGYVMIDLRHERTVVMPGPEVLIFDDLLSSKLPQPQKALKLLEFFKQQDLVI
jgi:glycosyltransferase involved in cell wall biosynthesis